MRRLGLGLLATVILAAAIAPAADAQEEARTFQVGLVYVVLPANGDEAVVFQAFVSPDAAPDGTIGLPVPDGARDISIHNDTDVPLNWVAREGGGIDVAAPGGTQGIKIVSRGVPFQDGIRFGGPAVADRTLFWVALPPGWNVTEPEARRDDADAPSLPGIWPRPEGHAIAFATLDGERDLHVRFNGPDAVTPPPVSWEILMGLGALLLVATVWAAFLVHRSIARPTGAKRMPILGHLSELRRRVVWTFGTVLAGAFVFFGFGFRIVELYGERVPILWPSIYDNAAAQVFGRLAAHGVPEGVEVVVITPWDAVVTQMGLAIGLAVAVAFPVLFYHAYAFLAPGMYPRERRAVLMAIPAVVVLFLTGAAFGLLLMLPLTTHILYSFAGTLDAEALLNVTDLVSVAALLALVFGIAFQLPLVMGLTARMGLVSAATYRKKWRHAVLIIAIVAAIITDPTVISQIIVATVLIVLYLIGLLLAQAVERRPAAAT